MAILIFCDGGVHGNGKVDSIGGYGAILKTGGKVTEFSGAEIGATNNQMEMTGALMALRSIVGKLQRIVVTSDSQYLVKGMNHWVHGWARKGWMTTDNKPVLNQDLWIPLKEIHDRHMVDWVWVKGHNGHVENERCDFLAGEAIKNMKLQLTSQGVA